MEKRNTLLLTVIAVATLLVAVVGATFAYFASTPSTGNGLALNATTQAASAAFTATAGTLTLEITADEMLRGSATAAEGDNLLADAATTATDAQYNPDDRNAPLVVTFTSAADGTPMSCTYDIVYTWTSTDVYDAYSANVTAGNEFTIQAEVAHTGDGASECANGANAIEQEKNWHALTFESNKTTLVTGAKIYSDLAAKDGQDLATKSTWDFTTKFYNRDADQTALAGKTYTGVFTVENVVC